MQTNNKKSMNIKIQESKIIQSVYFDKRVEEEDEPVTIDGETQVKYEALDDMYEDFFEDDFLGIAKVSID